MFRHLGCLTLIARVEKSFCEVIRLITLSHFDTYRLHQCDVEGDSWRKLIAIILAEGGNIVISLHFVYDLWVSAHYSPR